MLNLLDSVIRAFNKFARKLVAVLDKTNNDANVPVVVNILVRFISRFSYVRFAVAMKLQKVVNVIALPDVITNIKLQQQVYAFMAGQRFSKRQIRKFASQGYDIYPRRFVVIKYDKLGRFALEEEIRYIWDRPTVLDLYSDKFGHLMLDALSFDVEVDINKEDVTRNELIKAALDILSGGSSNIKLVNNTNLEQIKFFAPKSGASRIVYTTLDIPLNDLVHEVAAIMGITEYVESKSIDGGLDFKVFSKIGVLLLRQGMPLNANVADMMAVTMAVPNADGVVAWFKPGTLRKISSMSKFNSFTGFQGTLVSFEQKIWGKGTFVEVPEKVWSSMLSVYKKYGYSDVKGIQVIVNSDAVIGDYGMLSLKPENFIVLKTATDYKASAQLSQQFVFYHWNFNSKKAIAALKKYTSIGVKALVENAGLSSSYGRAIKMGLPSNLKLLRLDNASTMISGFVRRLFTVDLSLLKKGATFTVTSLPSDAFKHYVLTLGFSLEGESVIIGSKKYPINRIIVANVANLELKAVNGVYKVGAYKNPVTFTGDCPTEYIVINDSKLSGSFAFMHPDAPHRVLSGHDFDGDDLVVFSGEFFKYFRACRIKPLADIKLPENPSVVRNYADMHQFIALQYDAHIGMVERFADQIHSLITGAGIIYIGKQAKYITPIKAPRLLKEAYELIEFLFAQQQGVINAQKKSIEGLLSPEEIQEKVDAFVRKVYRIRSSKVKVRVETFRSFLKGMRGMSVSDYAELLTNVRVSGLTDIHKMFSKYLVLLNKWVQKYLLLTKLNADIGTADVHILDIRGKYTRWTSKRVGFSYRYIYQDWIYENGLAKQYNMLANKKDNWPRFYLIGNMFNMFMSMVSYAKRINSTRTDEILSLANVAIYTLGLETHRYIRNLVKELNVKEEVCWAFLASKVSDSAFFSIAPDNIVKIFVEHFNNLNEQGRLHDVAYLDSNNNGGAMEKEIIFHCDGAYTTKQPNIAFWAYVSEDATVVESGSIKTDTRQVAGECKAVVEAIRYAIDKDYDKVICKVDYEGLINWLNGTWQPKSKVAADYIGIIMELNKYIDIDIVKIPRKDNLADKYCKVLMKS